MLKRNWNWRNNKLFRHIIVIGEISIGRGPCPPSPCLCSKWGKQKRCSQIFREFSGVFQRNFNCSKNSGVLEPRTGQFSRTWGFEAKDLRLLGQGQGLEASRPRPRTSKCVLEANDVLKDSTSAQLDEKPVDLFKILLLLFNFFGGFGTWNWVAIAEGLNFFTPSFRFDSNWFSSKWF